MTTAKDYRFVTPVEEGAWWPSEREAKAEATRKGYAHVDSAGKAWLGVFTRIEERDSDRTAEKPERMVLLPELLERVRLSRSTIFRRMRAGTFPRRVDVGVRLSVWSERDVEAWLSAETKKAAEA